METIYNYWIDSDGFIYIGDQTKGARAATDDEIAAHLAATTALED
ncbi:hypothetical protein [Cronobacter sakazakii]|nr:hypothetical protein [Cronobacter sakazakii]MDT3544882.1 hypothetical protein [Cronobacter sakazakii]